MAIYDKNQEERIEELSDIIVDTYKRFSASQDYSSLSVKERWAMSRRLEAGREYCTMLEKYVAGNVNVKELQVGLAKIMDKNIESLSTEFESNKQKHYGKVLWFGAGAGSLMVVTLAQLYGLDKDSIGSSQLILMGIPSLCAIGLVVYSACDIARYAKKSNKMLRKVFLDGLDAEIVKNLPEEEFAKSLEKAKEKIIIV